MHFGTLCSMKALNYSLQLSAAFEGVFELSQPCHTKTECDIIGLQMQPSREAAPELRHAACIL